MRHASARTSAPGRLLSMLVLVLLSISVVACKGGGVDDDPILQLSADESLERGKELLEAGKYGPAEEYLAHAFEVAPNSASGREALLLSADALFLDGGVANFIKAQAKYTDFQNRFPTSDRSDYVQFQIASCLEKQTRKPDRDQKPTIDALNAYEELVRLYPTSDYVDEAQLQIANLRQEMAQHEYLVGRYNMTRKLYPAAVRRFDGLLEQYSDYTDIDEVLYYKGLAQLKSKKCQEAEQTFGVLRSEHSGSKFVKQIPETNKKGCE
jgi:outer membrane protein assembly factor BamD